MRWVLHFNLVLNFNFIMFGASRTIFVCKRMDCSRRSEGARGGN